MTFLYQLTRSASIRRRWNHWKQETEQKSELTKNLPQLGIEPSAIPWEGIMLPLHHWGIWGPFLMRKTYITQIKFIYNALRKAPCYLEHDFFLINGNNCVNAAATPPWERLANWSHPLQSEADPSGSVPNGWELCCIQLGIFHPDKEIIFIKVAIQVACIP